ncbi:DUF2974 domain-containing protein [Sutcliffiella cohnii]|uniref:DUF2974 domain-containing protein n=1 Tax=Sutcliffiella cohnii TaxID=33932 RepID=A0A223KKK1_9BACI|nr:MULTISPECIES: DUF2974 domain-containing protein [Sutcliffiella]AST89894.1 hypothetical protein BC6307_00680 [Sutcliffiella cohnii]MED4018243.1 DUF2974 domain-containing protein [Sutcliffiella cohnii]WBL15517.1 DUF2974 domain-containing protein [Sutcliffiella sp. NC1]
MGNMLDYLDWRGDLSFAQSPFNEVDNLILSQLAYVNFEGIVPPRGNDESISIKDAAEFYFKMYEEETIMNFGFLIRISVPLLKKLGESNRFGNARLSQYVNIIDLDEQKQFSAIHITLSDETIFVAFRGTDNTIVGWKENFNMSFMMPVPAQLEAVRYLNETVRGYDTKLRIGGHSKGGNLAIFASVMCQSQIKANILEVYNNDGPGFNREMTESKEYKEVLSRMKTIVPESSVVGMLLEHEEDYYVVKSSKTGFMQHDAMTWEVLGKGFVHVGHVTQESKLLDVTLKAWVNRMDKEQREQFVDAIAYVFHAANIESLDDLSRSKWKKASEMLIVINHMAPEHKEVLTKTLKLLFDEGRRVYKEAKSKGD